MKKVGILALAVILALGALGVGFAAWNQTLTINGSVTAATFDVAFTADTEPAAPTNGTAVATIATDGNSATVTVTNVYPGYTGDFTLTVTNSSSIPVSLVLTEDADTDAEGLFSQSSDPTGSVAAVNGTFVYTITVDIPDDWNQDNAGGTFTADYSLLATQAP